MDFRISLRALVRIITFAVAIIAVLTVLSVRFFRDARETKLQLQYSYVRAMTELANDTDNITTTLSKGIYSGTPEMLAEFASKLWKDSSSAKESLSQIPLADIQTDKINRFLSQVGNYSVSISKKAKQGEGLTLEEYSNLATLYEFSKKLSDEMWTIEQRVQTGEMSMTKVNSSLRSKQTPNPSNVTEGFASFEEGATSYPTLIYDGPFSDHILSKEPLLIKGLKTVDVKTALAKASKCSGISTDKLENKDDEAGKMPSYCFEADGTSISITKAGGLISYMLKNRSVDEMKIKTSDAIASANAYLLKLGVKNMTTTYFENINNVSTINFASLENDVTVYTDLIKVSVALDNGEIMGFDARGYIVNHYQRKFAKPKITEHQAKSILSPLLTVEKSKLALIPSDGLNEVLTYEFTCKSRQGQTVLVYVNTSELKEEQILILMKSENGLLTV